MKHAYQIMIAVLVMLLSIAMQTCSKNKNHSLINKAALTDTVKFYNNKLGTVTASVATLQLQKKQLYNEIINRDHEMKVLAKEFASVKSVIKYRSEIFIDSIRVNYPDTVALNFTRSGTINNKWYNFTWKSNQNGFSVNSLTIPTTTTVITGTKQKWIFGPQIITTEITNSNPYIKINTIKAVDIMLPQPWYKKWYLWFAVGAATGIAISR